MLTSAPGSTLSVVVSFGSTWPLGSHYNFVVFVLFFKLKEELNYIWPVCKTWHHVLVLPNQSQFHLGVRWPPGGHLKCLLTVSCNGSYLQTTRGFGSKLVSKLNLATGFIQLVIFGSKMATWEPFLAYVNRLL